MPLLRHSTALYIYQDSLNVLDERQVEHIHVLYLPPSFHPPHTIIIITHAFFLLYFTQASLV